MTDESEAAGEASLAELRRARASGRRLPDFFIVGHAKCGTTAMHAMLRSHPQIFMPVRKETQFLAHDQEDVARGGGVGQEGRPRTLEAYLSLFEAASAEQRAGEASTSYLRTPSAASRIAELCPDARIVAVFREPASFLYSLHLQLLVVEVENEPDFAQAIGLEQQRRRGGHVSSDPVRQRALLYSEHVRYVEQLRRFQERFGRERVLTLIYDDFRRDNVQVVRQILRFLEVDDSVEIEREDRNPTVRVRSHRGQKLVNVVSLGRGPVSRSAKALVKTVTSDRVRRKTVNRIRRGVIVSGAQPPDEEFMLELRRRFKGEVEALSDHLGRDLVSLWGYDEVR
jgi:hypothetical protein